MTLQITALNVHYAGKPILTDFSHTFSAASWHVILGKSGAGKSTLLRAIAGLIPYQGQICDQEGKDLSGRVSLMAQSDDLLSWLSVLENVMLGDRLRGQKPNRSRAEALLSAVGLGDFLTRRPPSLSGGQRQRVALARTLYEDRPFVLMDEPFSAVDAVTRYQLQNLAARLLREKTVIMITHDPAEALRLADELSILEGSPVTLHLQPLPKGTPPRDGCDPAPLLQALGEYPHLPEERDDG